MAAVRSRATEWVVKYRLSDGSVHTRPGRFPAESLEDFVSEYQKLVLKEVSEQDWLAIQGGGALRPSAVIAVTFHDTGVPQRG